MKGMALLSPLALLACEAPFTFPGPIATITIAPQSAELRQGDTLQLTATVRDSSGQVRTDRIVSWSSSEPGRVFVSATGRVLALVAGSVTITAAAAGVSDTASVFVLARVVGVTIDQGDLTLVPGGTLQLSATPYDPGGNWLGGRQTEWTSADPSILEVSSTGVIAAHSAGATTVTATSEGVSAGIAVRVERIAFTAVSAGEFRHTCGLATDGRYFCWGENGLGQLGIAAVANSTSPVAAAGAPRLALVTSGGTFTCGRTAGGQVYCWGSAARGRLGNGSFASTPQPGLVPLDAALASLGSGWNHTCGISPAGSGICWGEAPQVGNTELGPIARTPVSVLGGLSYAMIAAGEGFTCGLATDSLASCWGMNFANRLGVESLPATAEPVPVKGGLRFTAVTAGGLHACGLTASGGAYCWGANSAGQLGFGATADSTATPLLVSGGLSFATIAAGSHSTCALTSDGTAYCWGANDAGQLGGASVETCGGSPCSRTPLPVSGNLRFSAISVGDHHACGRGVDGVVYCWGLNDRGQLGDGSTVNRAAPVRVFGQR